MEEIQPQKPISTFKEAEEQLQQPEIAKKRDEAFLSASALATKQLVQMGIEKEIKKINDKEIDEMFSNLELSDLDYLSKLQFDIKELYGKELKPVKVPGVWNLLVQAMKHYLRAKDNPDIDQKELKKKLDFFMTVLSHITGDKIYIPYLPKEYSKLINETLH
ncbi:MAG: hypothetical protein A2Y67_03205 [Candidatus Buchananbacteria bacterium RBG_13_39_9]|jgi:hypothetical protein|uniref:Uncharacterized protein n=1 Tax=Candidatus Buchananbacteria bacterium RBG_13_39_9 TaxID=1797531 RepID=A0A1G1XQ10_9BACT|nr:MAG: hypothetical protein A2Y67_03205 [Candidatus Buchananbacteria bacterium RBG_13_39_9]